MFVVLPLQSETLVFVVLPLQGETLAESAGHKEGNTKNDKVCVAFKLAI